MAREYVDGTSARKLNAQMRPEKKNSDRRLNEKRQQQVRRNQQRALNIDLPYLLILIVASVCTLTLCFNYICLQTSINSRITEIEQLEQQLDALKSENDALQGSIDTSVDLNEVYRIATEELGMVYAGKDQLITYDKTESEYVRQYEDIPKY